MSFEKPNPEFRSPPPGFIPGWKMDDILFARAIGTILDWWIDRRNRMKLDPDNLLIEGTEGFTPTSISDFFPPFVKRIRKGIRTRLSPD